MSISLHANIKLLGDKVTKKACNKETFSEDTLKPCIFLGHIIKFLSDKLHFGNENNC